MARGPPAHNRPSPCRPSHTDIGMLVTLTTGPRTCTVTDRHTPSVIRGGLVRRARGDPIITYHLCDLLPLSPPLQPCVAASVRRRSPFTYKSHFTAGHPIVPSHRPATTRTAHERPNPPRTFENLTKADPRRTKETLLIVLLEGVLVCRTRVYTNGVSLSVQIEPGRYVRMQSREKSSYRLHERHAPQHTSDSPLS